MPEAKGAKGGKLHPLNMRTTREVREWIERSAAASGRSLSAEVEARLERSFVEDKIFGGHRIGPLTQLMAMQFSTAAMIKAFSKGLWRPQDDAWLDDPECYRAGMLAVVDFLVASMSKLDVDAMVTWDIAALKERLPWILDKEDDK
jgi:hypothetical protein